MTTFTKGITAAAVLALTGSAMAQITITPNGNGAATTNGRFQITGVPSSPISFTTGNATFNATTTASADNAFQNFWGFRANNDTRNFWFANSVAGGVASTAVVAGDNTGNLNTGGYNGNVSNTTSQYNFDYQLRWQISHDGTGPNVLTWATITNNSLVSALSLNLFHYGDFDPNGSFSHPSSFAANVFSMTSGPITVNYAGFGATAAQNTDFSVMRNAYNAGTLLNFNNTFDNSGDFTGGFQWGGISVPAGGSITVYAAFAINRAAVPTPGAFALMGIAGVAAARRRRA